MTSSPAKPGRAPILILALAAALVVATAALIYVLTARDRTPPAARRPAAAVLPVEANMIGGDNSNYSALFTEALTSELARLGTISVASYSDAMQFEGQRRPIAEVAAVLKSSYIVAVSIDDEASEILVVARIVDAATERNIWAADYRGARDDVRGIGQRIAVDISTAILSRR